MAAVAQSTMQSASQSAELENFQNQGKAQLSAPPAPAEAREFYTTQELADRLRIQPITVYRLARRGDLVFYLVGRAMRFRHQDVEAFLDKCRGTARPE